MPDRAPDPPKDRLRLAKLDRSRATQFDLVPGADMLRALALELGLSALRKVRLMGELVPLGRADWRLEGALGATIVQPCGITLEPVTTRIDEPVTRSFVADLAADDAPAEQEMPEDDSVEPLPETLDLTAVLTEALMLAVPAFPRAPGAELGAVAAAGPGVTPMTDDDTKPFAGLRDALKKNDG